MSLTRRTLWCYNLCKSREIRSFMWCHYFTVS